VEFTKEASPAETLQQHFRIRPVRTPEHSLFNLLNFLYFMKSDYNYPLLIERPPLSLFVCIPYVLFSEIYFFGQKRYFVILGEQIVGVIALQENVEGLYVASLAVSPFYRKIGIATYMLNWAELMANHLCLGALELSVSKANRPALRLYLKLGFRKKKEKRRSFVLRKDIKKSD
jgi:ribosomal protein S18 acetylase RimI-like enzyme